MKYIGTVYRPPSEANSYILQATVGCSHNRCTFCSMYKDKTFQLRPIEELKADLEQAKRLMGPIKRIFLADGNVLCMPSSQILELLQYITQYCPEVERVACYAGPKDLLNKTPQELKSFQQTGLKIIYLGVESGSDLVLEMVQKGVSSQEMVEAGRKSIEANLILSCTIILGLAGLELSESHAVETAKVLSQINPHFIGALTLHLEAGTPLSIAAQEGRFTALNPYQTIAEMRQIISHIQVDNCLWRSNHITNYLPVGGHLMRDQQAMLSAIDNFLAGSQSRTIGVKRLPTL